MPTLWSSSISFCFFLPNSVIPMFSQLKNSASGKIKLSKLYFCLECFSPHPSSYHVLTSSRGDVLFFYQIQRSLSCVAELTSHQFTLETAWESDSLGVLAAASFGHYPFPIIAITLVFSERSHQYLKHKSLHPPSS